MKYKTQISAVLISVTAMAARCNKEIPPDPNEYKFTINANLNYTSETIKLGDTLKLEVRLPDTLVTHNYLNQSRIEKVNSLQKASFDYSLYVADSIARTDHWLTFKPSTYNVYSYFDIYLESGTTGYEPYTLLMQNVTPPYNVILNIIPRVKGIFYFQLGRGSFDVNQTWQGKFFVHLPSDSHVDIVNRNIDSYYWLKAVELNRQLGIETYAFRVN